MILKKKSTEILAIFCKMGRKKIVSMDEAALRQQRPSYNQQSVGKGGNFLSMEILGNFRI